jgi:hypothetical protein
MATTYGGSGTLLAVTEVASSAGDGTVTLTWLKADDATGYRIYVNTAETRPGTHYAEILDGDVETFIAGGLVNGTTYFFWIETLGGTLPNPVTAAQDEVPSAT